MIENQKDLAATKVARKAHEIHAPSWISIAGHKYLRGRDRSALREVVFMNQKHCMICGEPGLYNDEMDHEVGGRPLDRCDCYNTRLADGTLHTNVQRVHSRCHVLKHHRIIQWRRA